jgi:phenylacetic acid degradation operon negative regulatory protein
MHDDPSAAALELVKRFHRQRPLRAGSLLVTLFGDAIVPRGGAVALGSLIQLAAPFGINERLVRTAVARLGVEGWVAARKVGKRSEYRLTPEGRERFAEATRRIYGASAETWSGRWTLVLVPQSSAHERRRLRQELAWQGFGEVGSGLFAHPEVGAHGLPRNALVFEAKLDAADAASRLVALGWNLGDLAARYRRFVRRFAHTATSLGARAADPVTGFTLRTLLIHEYRRLHLRDPLLPPRLLPADWPGLKAAELCRSIYARVFSASELYLSTVGAPLEGLLPPPDPEVFRRFGGIDGPR